MKSKWFLIVAVVLAVMLGLTVSMAGCKATTTETTAAKTTAAETTAAKTTAAAETTTAGEPVTITVTSWRTEDIDAWNAINAVFMKAHPNIKVEFKPIKNTEYYAQIGTALETGTGVADVLGLHSFGTGKNIYNGGHLAKLNDLVTGLTDLSAHSRAAWATEDGISYAVPIGAVVHGIYYNKDIFDKYNLKEPKTWSEFIKICDTLKENGETVIAQGSKEGWTLYETGYNDYGCNFYGGEKSRQKLMAGEMKFTDEPFVKAFEAVDSLTKYYPKGYQAIDYVSSQQMFTTGKAAIFIGGSWEIGTFKNMGLDFKL
ncbi:MAG: extracellular solute-binding protein, partial [Actinobacteria bacterium]|nr:extracellular solute-binding protein [Actinomycetota bacterium]